MQLINLNKLGEHFTIGIKGGNILSLAFNGQVYDGWYTPVHKGDKIDCGLNYDPITDYRGLVSPRTIFELAAPRYYYTDTDFLRSIGLTPLVNSILGSTRNVQVLIRSRDNYRYLPDANAFKAFYLLAQTQFNDKLSSTDLDNIYQTLINLNTYTPIIPKDRLKELIFYDAQHNVISVTRNDYTSATNSIKSCGISSIADNYHINEYDRKGISYDIYIGSYHIVIYDCQDMYYCLEKDDSSNKDGFWEIGHSCRLELTTGKEEIILEELGYHFKPDSSGKILTAESGNGSVFDITQSIGYDITLRFSYGENPLQDTVIASQTGTTTWFNADPNIYTKIGKLPDDTVGVLPKGADMNNVGVGSDRNDGLLMGLKLTDITNATPDKLLFPLGTYYLDPNAKYSDYKNFPTTSDTNAGTPLSITAYTLDGMTVMQEAVWRGFATYRRVGYQTGLGTTSWTGWSQRKWN